MANVITAVRTFQNVKIPHKSTYPVGKKLEVPLDKLGTHRCCVLVTVHRWPATSKAFKTCKVLKAASSGGGGIRNLKGLKTDSGQVEYRIGTKPAQNRTEGSFRDNDTEQKEAKSEHNADSCLHEKCVTGVHHSCEGPTLAEKLALILVEHPEVEQVVLTWPTLPEPIKAGIKVLVQ